MRKYKRTAGLDEVGRGPLAGPVVASAVVITTAKFKSQISKLKIKDSKKLSAKKRQEFYKILTRHPAIEWGIGRVSEKVIDKINILEATKLAMIRALQNLGKRSVQKIRDREIFVQLDFLILDGEIKLDLPIRQRSIIKADEKIFSCMAASIIAKVTRDRLMERYHKKYPQYGFDRNKGYLTKYHTQMLKRYGACKIHRESFSPIKNLKLKSQNSKPQLKTQNY